MINYRQFKVSLFLGLLISLIKLVFILSTQDATTQASLKTISLLLHTDVWFAPLGLAFLYFLMVTSTIYLVFRVINYSLKLFYRLSKSTTTD